MHGGGSGGMRWLGPYEQEKGASSCCFLVAVGCQSWFLDRLRSKTACTPKWRSFLCWPYPALRAHVELTLWVRIPFSFLHIDKNNGIYFSQVSNCCTLDKAMHLVAIDTKKLVKRQSFRPHTHHIPGDNPAYDN